MTVTAGLHDLEGDMSRQIRRALHRLALRLDALVARCSMGAK
jgi:hypothetical protein